MNLKNQIQNKIPPLQERVGALLKDYGDTVIDNITVKQVYGGIRGVKALVTDISYVDPNEGIRLRGYTIPELLQLLPKPENSDYPYAGAVYYLLLVGEIPTKEDSLEVEGIWKERQEVPEYIFRMLDAMSEDAHPMTLFSQAVLGLQTESVFAKRYLEGMTKAEYWEAALEDSLNLTAKLPVIAAYIYQLKYGDVSKVKPSKDLDWSANLAHMLGVDNPGYMDLMRLFVFLHSDHESGNVSAHATHLVGSTLSDVYYACSAAMNGLAGPLHGLANQETLRWLLEAQEEIGSNPTKEDVEKFAWDTLNAGKVIPGYGHPVLRQPDPRFTTQFEFGKKHIKDDALFDLVQLIYEVVPGVLKQLGKVKNPWPNVDAISGSLQYHYGMKEFDFYTVLFGVSRILGVSSNLVWARAVGQPIERPKSLTTKMLEDLVKK